MRVRLCYLDVLKGILIILVVLGHAIQATFPNYLHNFLFRFIYSFHMPLFFVISGFLTYRGMQGHDDKLMKRAVQLLIPFVCWAFISPLLTYGSFNMDKTVKALLYPDNGLWFLYNLFFYNAIFFLSERWAERGMKQEYIFAGFFMVLYLLMAIFHTMFNITQICWYMPFFAIGYYGRKYACAVKKKKHVTLVCGVIYCMLMPFWMMREDPLFYCWINLGSVFSYLYRCLVEVVGAIFFFLLGRKFLNWPLLGIAKLGTRTLGVYALQFIILYHLEKVFTSMENEYLKIIVETILTVLLCFIVTEFIHKLKYVRLFLIGEKL